MASQRGRHDWSDLAQKYLATYRFPSSAASGHTPPLLSGSHTVYADIPCCLQYDFPNVFTLCKWHLLPVSFLVSQIQMIYLRSSVFTCTTPSSCSASQIEVLLILSSNVETGSREPQIWQSEAHTGNSAKRIKGLSVRLALLPGSPHSILKLCQTLKKTMNSIAGVVKLYWLT